MLPTPNSPDDPRTRFFLLGLSKNLYILMGLASLAMIGVTVLSMTLNKPLLEVITEAAISTDSSSISPDASATIMAEARSRKAAEIKDKFQVAAIAGRSPEEVEKVLGKPMFSGSVSPMGLATCPCQQKNYQYGLVEVIYIGGKADWITVNLPKEKVDTVGAYMATQVFKNPDFVSVKVSTN